MAHEFIKAKLYSAATQYDRRQSTRQGYNPNALALYFGRLQNEVFPAIERGVPVYKALEAAFNDRLLAALLKAVSAE